MAHPRRVAAAVAPEAEACGGTLRECKQKQRAVVEDDGTAASYPRRLARAATSFVAALFGGRDDDGDASRAAAAAVRRFEWFADGAGEFLRFAELGSTPLRCAVHVDPLIGRLLAGEELRYRVVRRSQYHLLWVRPIRLDGRGVEAKLLFVYEDDDAPEKNLCLGSIMRLDLRDHGRRRHSGPVPGAAGHAALPAHGGVRAPGARPAAEAGLLVGAVP